MIKSVFQLAVMAGLFYSCASPLSSLQWMEGTWSTTRAKGGERLEIWDKSNSKLYSGKGLKVVDSDTTLLETLKLTYENKHIWYIPTVPDQNDAKPVPFKMISQEKSRLVFENPKHDFPQRITYIYYPTDGLIHTSAADRDSLHVRVEDLEGKGIDFWFRRK